MGLILYRIINYLNNLLIKFNPFNPYTNIIILIPFVVIIEPISLIIRPLTLSIRLTVNIIAGHIIRLELRSCGSLINNEQIYNSLVINHAFIIIFFTIIPFIIGGNFLIPLILGTTDIAYPRMNNIIVVAHFHSILFITFRLIFNQLILRFLLENQTIEKVLRKKRNDIYMKWLKFDNSYNSWIHQDVL
ncbi:Cytochrome c oxidase subunit 1 [Atta colombica]|uniref:Cytochrome c oxidase subunit 1 n=1 Tax=Atta colombica TaxID=520822 RepID=A0A151I458_9HYME|nr:Cytochrome c oxidase subunit 1 [Atta colombica]